MQDIYIFSGLGVDERVFKYIDFGESKPTFIKWVAADENESIEQYAQKLIPQITTDKPVLIGLSFGGMMAIEVAKHIDTQKIILIASAKTYHEVSFYYRWAGFVKFHQLLSISLLKRFTFFSAWLFGIEDKLHKEMFTQILHDSDGAFLTWAIDRIVTWKNQTIPKALIHIHGSHDHVLPLNFVRNTIIIEGGGHFMTVNRAKELSAILRVCIL